MRWLLLSAFCGALVLFVPGYARAQAGGCGYANYGTYECEGPDCTASMKIYYFIGCEDQDEGQFWAPIHLQCGTGTCGPSSVLSFAPAGYCDCPGTEVVSSPSASVNVENTVYVDAYVRVCAGRYRYVAVRIAI